ncbi:MAG: tetratricopeptide repeat protein [Candidatus Schekmanbacteria bacterium]|nr:tetratricopeptide repeat protein [Candidatus Schekmanbacteria bacterium]
MILKQRGDWDNASRILLQLTRFNPSCAECYFHLGEIEESKLDFTKAVTYYTKAAIYDPVYYFNLGLNYQTVGNLKASINAFQNYHQSFPMSLEGMIALGISYRKSGDIIKGEEIFKSVLYLSPDNPAAHFNLSLIYIESGRKNEALFHIETYRRITGTKWMPYNIKKVFNEK